MGCSASSEVACSKTTVDIDALVSAISKGHIVPITYMLKRNPDLLTKASLFPDYQSIWHLACRHGHLVRGHMTTESIAPCICRTAGVGLSSNRPIADLIIAGAGRCRRRLQSIQLNFVCSQQNTLMCSNTMNIYCVHNGHFVLRRQCSSLVFSVFRLQNMYTREVDSMH